MLKGEGSGGEETFNAQRSTFNVQSRRRRTRRSLGSSGNDADLMILSFQANAPCTSPTCAASGCPPGNGGEEGQNHCGQNRAKGDPRAAGTGRGRPAVER